MKTFVVGVDGSESAGEALRLAAAEAELHGARLRIVVVWEMPAAAYGGGFVPPIDDKTFDALRIGRRASRTKPRRWSPSSRPQWSAQPWC